MARVLPNPLQYSLPIGETVEVNTLIFKTGIEPGICHHWMKGRKRKGWTGKLTILVNLLDFLLCFGVMRVRENFFSGLKG